MSPQESITRSTRTISNIESVLRAHDQLQQYATALQISMENAVIVLRGELPSASLKAELVPVVRQAGVLCKINDCVEISN